MQPASLGDKDKMLIEMAFWKRALVGRVRGYQKAP